VHGLPTVQFGCASPKRRSKLHYGQGTCFLQALLRVLQCSNRVLAWRLQVRQQVEGWEGRKVLSALWADISSGRLAGFTVNSSASALLRERLIAESPTHAVLPFVSNPLGFGRVSAACSWPVRREEAFGFG